MKVVTKTKDGLPFITYHNIESINEDNGNLWISSSEKTPVFIGLSIFTVTIERDDNE